MESTRQVLMSCTHWHFLSRRKVTNILIIGHPLTLLPLQTNITSGEVEELVVVFGDALVL